ncbi:hypothetical protein ACIQXW_04310 [Lysinibacillus sp. NPDC097162]|uniref:hypothetical protein n=1 Tax=Lysinibacillus sp. NPDC097162 TaxID=3364140 RepID=UPI0037FABD62
MKKYWKMILLCFIIVMIVGSYYIQLAIASKNEVSFKIETTSGDKEEIENLMLQASYQSGDSYRRLYITEDGSTHQISHSIMAKLKDPFATMMFQKYIEEHRNFMRGKVLFPSNFSEDQTHIIYAAPPNNGQKVIQGDLLTLNIDLLDKKKNDNISFEVSTTAQASYNFIYVNNIYKENGEMKILATAAPINGGEELHLYAVDVNKKKLLSDSILAKVNSEKEFKSSLSIFRDNNKLQNDYFVYMIDKYKDQYDDGGRITISRQISLYNNKNNVQEELMIPEELTPNLYRLMLREADIFIPDFSADGLQLNRYNIEKKQWEKPLLFNLVSPANDEREPFLQIANGKVYLAESVSNEHLFFIYDLYTGESLYKGKIIKENGENTDYTLHFELLNEINY